MKSPNGMKEQLTMSGDWKKKSRPMVSGCDFQKVVLLIASEKLARELAHRHQGIFDCFGRAYFLMRLGGRAFVNEIAYH